MTLLHREHYGYSLRQALEEVGLHIEESTLYPLLRRLESQGLLVSEWREEAKRKKRFYRLSDRGSRVLEQLLAEWNTIHRALTQLVRKAACHGAPPELSERCSRLPSALRGSAGHPHRDPRAPADQAR
jgi:DNA-binding PadR family transcriptional regulator